MRMNYLSKLAILGLVTKIFAAEFSVISFDGDCQLSLGGNNVAMTADPQCSNLYKATADAKDGATYKYVCGGKAEEFDRVLKGDKSHNELFQRQKTVTNMPEFGYPKSAAEPWERSIGRTELFDPTYVPTVIIDTSKDFFVSAGGSKFKKMTFILKDSVHVFENVPTSSKNDEQDKFQVKFDLPGTGIYNRTGFKFRPSSEDPVFIRQILYGDILHAVGNPTHESVAARVYLSDGTPVALYVLQEDVTTESFANSAFHGNADGSLKSHDPMPVHNCDTGADFTAETNALYGFSNTDDPNATRLYELMTKIDQTDPTNEQAVKELNDNWIDINVFLKALALEYLAGHWDSYWFLTTNYAVYSPPGEKYYFIDQDFDQTWSVGMKDEFEPESWPKKPYTEFVKDQKFWKSINSDLSDEHGTRTLVNKFIGCDGKDTCQTKELFENHLKNMVKHIVNPVALENKVNGYIDRLDEEIKWDYGLTRLHTGSYAKDPLKAEGYYNFKYEDWLSGFNGGPNSRYGLLEWTKIMADTICNQFNIEYDKEPLTPEAAAKIGGDSTESSLKTNSQTSGSIANRANVALAVIATILSVLLL
eukprot:jgi/Orpsp1_1/1177018/evm.model.c7180000059839.1